MVMMTASNDKEFEQPPQGNHVAVCYRVIDLGTQTTTFNGEEKTAHKIMLGWELVDEMMEDGKPFSVNNRYTLSGHPKATLRKTLESWRGRPYRDDELPFDTAKLLGQPCMINVTHTTKDGKTYANVAAVTPIPKNMTVPLIVNDMVHFDLSDFRQEVFDSFSEGLKKTIAGSPEYKARS